MEIIEYEAPDVRSSYVPYVPDFVRTIEKPRAPPLLTVGGGAPQLARYTVDGLDIELDLVVTSHDSSAHTRQQLALAMCPYVKVAGEDIYSREACVQCDLQNVARERHNKFIVAALNAFLEANDCGTSAHRITAPAAPEDHAVARLDAIKKLTADKLGTSKRAIAYLAECGLYCGKDFEFDGAMEAANDEALKAAIKYRIEKGGGKVRVRAEGHKPCWWDGESPTDEDGKFVRWERGLGHTFLTPDVCVVVTEPTPAPVAMITQPEQRPPAANEFDSLKIPDSTAQLLAIETKLSDD
jgi:hypothetical protein